MTNDQLDKEAADFANNEVKGKPKNLNTAAMWSGAYVGYKKGFRRAEYRESLRRQTNNRDLEPVPAPGVYSATQFEGPTHNED